MKYNKAVERTSRGSGQFVKGLRNLRVYSWPLTAAVMVTKMTVEEKTQKPKNDALEMLEAPWLKRQVETHLFYGLLAPYLPFDLYFIPGATTYHKKALLLATTKVAGFFISFLFIVGSAIPYLRKDPDAPAVLILGFVWFPALEFIPKITPKQKYITIARIIITVVFWFIWFRV